MTAPKRDALFWLRGLGLVVGAGLVWTLTLWLNHTFNALPFPFSYLALILAVGLPAFFAAPLAYRWRLPWPVVWSTVGYCLGSALNLALTLEPGIPFSRHLQVAAVHFATATLTLPLVDGSFAPALGNLLWVVCAVVIAQYGLDAYRHKPAQKF
jgi:hypothetical protein